MHTLNRKRDDVFGANGIQMVTQAHPSPSDVRVKSDDPLAKAVPAGTVEIEVGLLTGGQDRPYAFGLAMALVTKGVCLDVVGSDEIDSPELHQTFNLRFLNLKRNWRPNAGAATKALGLLIYYARLIRYAAAADAKIFHILWNNRIEFFDRTVLMVYFKTLRKKIVITAHNVNARKRDSNDSSFNRITLKTQYRLADHIFVHTAKMKRELCEDFAIRPTDVTVIRHPINNAFPDTDLTPGQAKQRLGLGGREKAILFFGRLRPYKGLEYLLAAFQRIAALDVNYRLIIAGELKKGSEAYFDEIQQMIDNSPYRNRILQRTEFIPDKDAEIYLKAADVLVLPYKEIFQSGVLFLAYSFGLPVVAADVGSFREEIIEGRTGFLCKPCDADDLAKAIETYFESDLFQTLDVRRPQIRDYAFAQHSWEGVAEATRDVYAGLLDR